jgi:hypothetical protein
MNRKIFEENVQLKEKNIENTQQLDNFKIIFRDNKQEQDSSFIALRQELDECYQREVDLRNKLQEVLQSKEQESLKVISSLKKQLEETESYQSNTLNDLNKVKQGLEAEQHRADIFEKKHRQVEKDLTLVVEKQKIEKCDLESKVRSLEEKCELIKRQALNEKQKLEEKFNTERTESKKQLTELEHKIEEVIKEKAQLSCKYGQMVENNRELNSMMKNAQIYNDKKSEETRYFYFLTFFLIFCFLIYLFGYTDNTWLLGPRLSAIVLGLNEKYWHATLYTVKRKSRISRQSTC